MRLLLFLVLTLNLFASPIDNFISKINIKYTSDKEELYIKIFKNDYCEPRYIEEMEKKGFQPGEILVLSVIYGNIDDSFEEFIYTINQLNKNLSEIASYYGFTENELINKAKKILTSKISRSDILDYRNYNKVFIFTINGGLEYSQEFNNSEISYHAGSSIDIYPLDFLNVSGGFELRSIPVEDTNQVYQFSITKKGLSIGAGVYPLDPIYLSAEYEKASGTENYNSSELLFEAGIDI